MRLKELNSLVRLANDLDGKGLYSEADIIDGIIKKFSMALVGHHGGEDVGGYGRQDYDWKSPGGYPLSDWVSAIKSLGESIVLIYLDFSKIGEYIKKLPGDEASKFKEGVSSGMLAEEFFSKFPMPNITSRYSLSDHVFVVMDTGTDFGPDEKFFGTEYGDEYPEYKSSVERSPRYLGHDLGHKDSDLEPMTKSIIFNIIIKNYSGSRPSGFVKSFLSQAFGLNNIFSDSTDAINDLVSIISRGGDLLRELEMVPTKLVSENDSNMVLNILPGAEGSVRLAIDNLGKILSRRVSGLGGEELSPLIRGSVMEKDLRRSWIENNSPFLRNKKGYVLFLF